MELRDYLMSDEHVLTSPPQRVRLSRSKWNVLNNFNKLQSAAKKIKEVKFLGKYRHYF